MQIPAPRLARLAIAVLAASILQLAQAGDALAHVSLRSITPADASTVKAAPDHVILTFSGPIKAGRDSIKVFGPDGSRLDAGAPTPGSGSRVVQPLHASRDVGSWSVSYRVASEDGHVIVGYAGFAVGQPGGGTAAADASREDARTPRTLQAAFSFARFVEVFALLALAGGGVFAALVAPGSRPRMLGTALLTLLVAYAVGFATMAAILHGGGLVDALTTSSLQAAAQTPFGRALTIRVAITLVAAGPVLLLNRSSQALSRSARWALGLVFACVAASLSITGHAVTTEPLVLRMPTDMLHVVAAAVWVGGLLQLWLLREQAADHLEWISRFSRTAFACVVVVLMSGVYATFAELGTLSPGELLDSRYGRLIAAKLLLFLGTLPFAWNNMATFVPALVDRPRDAPYMLRQYVLRELILLVAVIGFTIWLIATPQPV